MDVLWKNRYWREAGFILGGWLIVTIIAGVITAVNHPSCSYTTTTWSQLVSNQSAQFSVWAILTPGIFWMTRIPVRPLGRFVGYQLGAAGAVLGLVSLLRAVIHNWTMHDPEARHAVLGYAQASLERQGHFDVLIYLGLFTVGLVFTHYHRAQDRERRAAELESELSRAQLQVLQAQVNPHFLFNALNTVSSLVEDDPTATRRVLAQLSSLLRRSLDSSSRTEIPLSEEVAFVRQYLDIMQVRFGDRLVHDVDVPAALMDARVPAFVLQPLVENAIKHGVSRIARRGRVRVAARRDGDTLFLSVDDNGPGVTDTHTDGTGGVGLAAVRSRLRQMYGTAGRLTLSTGASGDSLAPAKRKGSAPSTHGTGDRKTHGQSPLPPALDGAHVTVRVPYRPVRTSADADAGDSAAGRAARPSEVNLAAPVRD